MNKIDWKAKLSSRKFWALVGAMAVSVLTACGVIPATTEAVVGVIGAIGACVCYMFAEAHVDKARENKE